MVKSHGVGGGRVAQKIRLSPTGNEFTPYFYYHSQELRTEEQVFLMVLWAREQVKRLSMELRQDLHYGIVWNQSLWILFKVCGMALLCSQLRMKMGSKCIRLKNQPW